VPAGVRYCGGGTASAGGGFNLEAHPGFTPGAAPLSLTPDSRPSLRIVVLTRVMGVTAGGAPLAPTYEHDEAPTRRIVAGLGGQLALLMVVPLAILPALVVQLAGESDAVAARAVVASMVVCGLTTLALTVRLGRLRSDSLYVATVDLVSLPFCILALASGGPATLAALVVVSGLFQVAIGLRMSYLRRLVTPQVRGTVLILAFAALVPVLADAGSAVEQRLDWFVPVSVVGTAVTIVLISVWGPRPWRIWGPALGLVVGLGVAAGLGAYDFELVADAAWIGFADVGSSPGWGIDYGTFASMLPSFLIVSFAILVRMQGISSNTQMVSWRTSRALDFREVQRANWRMGVGTMLSGAAGSLPVTIAGVGPAFINQTRCASRRMGTIAGCFFLLAAFVPKLRAIAVAIPRPILAAYVIVALIPLVLRVVISSVQRLRSTRDALVILLPLAVGLCVEFGVMSFPPDTVWHAVSQNGLTAGSLVLVVAAILNSLIGRRASLEVELSARSTGELRRFVTDFAERQGCDEHSVERLEAAAEEALAALSEHASSRSLNGTRRVRVALGRIRSGIELEFVSAPSDGQNLEERIALLAEPEAETMETTIERDAALRLLRHYASNVSHRQYLEAEILTAVVSDAGSPRRSRWARLQGRTS